MNINNTLNLIGGLAMFLYGMKMMGDGLEAAAGNRMKRILERLTTNRFLGVFVGALITALIQSSSGTTVMLVGFVNSGLMTLNQAVWVIMGANIGTTITGQLIALDINQIAPLIAFVGVVMAQFFKKKSVRHYGVIIAGLGILFIGMTMMSSALKPLRESAYFINLMSTLQSPILGILVGMAFSSIIQSSSASVGILQTLAMSGLVQLHGAVYILLGMKIGTCVTALIASIGTSRNAKRVAVIHYSFNIIEAILFAIAFRYTGIVDFVFKLTPENASAQIANMHTICSTIMTILLLPFGLYLVRFAEKVLPEREDEAGDMRLMYINYRGVKEQNIGSTAIVMSQLLKEVHRMFGFALQNVVLGFKSIEEGTLRYMDEIENNEETVDFLNKEIAVYISNVISSRRVHDDAGVVSAMLKVAGNIERISDHAVNFAGYAENLLSKELSLSDIASNEVREMHLVCADALRIISERIALADDTEVSTGSFGKMLTDIQKAEQLIDDMTVLFRDNQLDRMREGTCAAEASIIYSEMLTDFERIGDHMLNIAEAYAGA
ncbi:MAG: Na/Pi cotransporter family protein [Clostridiales bacterium]|nr:Na/Pi cotransporter family protein [Clostridiales bacterium]